MPKKKSTTKDPFKSVVSEALGEKPKHRGRKPKDPELIPEYYDRKYAVFSPSGSSHLIFTGVKLCQQVNENTLIGTRVLVARYPNFYKIYLYSFHKPGELTFPRGGVKVWNANDHQVQSFYNESVALHPKGGYHRFAHVQEIDVDILSAMVDTSKTSEVLVPA